MAKDIVLWECKAPAHRALPSAHGNGGLTIHEDGWAYCDGAGADERHEWVATGGVPLESVVRWTAPAGNVAPRITITPATGSAAKPAPKTTGVRRT